jgi:hypothetical protein
MAMDVGRFVATPTGSGRNDERKKSLPFRVRQLEHVAMMQQRELVARRD